MKKRNLLLTVLSASVFTSCMIGCSNSNHTITFDTCGGTEIAPLNVKHNTLAIEPNDPVKLPYGFTGWYTDKDYTNVFDFTQPVTQNLTLHAKWSNTIEFTYLYNSSSNTIAFDLVAAFEDPFTEVATPLTIDWGDGKVETYTESGEDIPSPFTHTYTKGESGKTVYKVTILGIVASLTISDGYEGCHFIQSINVNGLPYSDIVGDLKLGSMNAAGEPSQVSEITLPRNLTTIPFTAFQYTSIKEFVAGKRISTIEPGAFYGVATLENVDFSKATSLRNIMDSAFYGCDKLKSIVLPENLATIESAAFGSCDKLTTVTFTSKMPPLLDGVAPFDAETVETIYVPKGCKNIYITHWNEEYPLLVSKLVESE